MQYLDLFAFALLVITVATPAILTGTPATPAPSTVPDEPASISRTETPKHDETLTSHSARPHLLVVSSDTDALHTSPQISTLSLVHSILQLPQPQNPITWDHTLTFAPLHTPDPTTHTTRSAHYAHIPCSTAPTSDADLSPCSPHNTNTLHLVQS